MANSKNKDEWLSGYMHKTSGLDAPAHPHEPQYMQGWRDRELEIKLNELENETDQSRAIRLLTQYLRVGWEAAGLTWTEANSFDVQNIVEVLRNN